jgi:hypothetical protein
MPLPGPGAGISSVVPPQDPSLRSKPIPQQAPPALLSLAMTSPGSRCLNTSLLQSSTSLFPSLHNQSALDVIILLSYNTVHPFLPPILLEPTTSPAISIPLFLFYLTLPFARSRRPMSQQPSPPPPKTAAWVSTLVHILDKDITRKKRRKKRDSEEATIYD